MDLLCAQPDDPLEMPCHAAKVFEAMQGQWLSSCLGVLLDLHIPEILSSAPKPLDIEEVSAWLRL